MATTITLEDRRLTQLLKDATFAASFPSVVQAAGAAAINQIKTRGCKPCGQAKLGDTNKAALNRMKQAIASLGPDSREKFKKSLNADTIRVIFRNGDTGKLLRVTF